MKEISFKIFAWITKNTVFIILLEHIFFFLNSIYIPRRKLGIYWIQVRRAATAAAAVEISLWTR